MKAVLTLGVVVALVVLALVLISMGDSCTMDMLRSGEADLSPDCFGATP